MQISVISWANESSHLISLDGGHYTKWNTDDLGLLRSIVDHRSSIMEFVWMVNYNANGCRLRQAATWHTEDSSIEESCDRTESVWLTLELFESKTLTNCLINHHLKSTFLNQIGQIQLNWFHRENLPLNVDRFVLMSLNENNKHTAGAESCLARWLSTWDSQVASAALAAWGSSPFACPPIGDCD